MSRFKYYMPSQIIEDKCTGKRYYGNKELAVLLNELHETNEQLKEDNKILNRINDRVNGWNGLAHDKIFKLEKENEQLKQRNDRQAKQLDRLYHLVEEKDWRTLSDILDDFKRCEEQLQRESGTYSD